MCNAGHHFFENENSIFQQLERIIANSIQELQFKSAYTRHHYHEWIIRSLKPLNQSSTELYIDYNKPQLPNSLSNISLQK